MVNFSPRDRAAARTKFSYAWSVSNALKGRRGDVAPLEGYIQITNMAQRGVAEAASATPP